MRLRIGFGVLCARVNRVEHERTAEIHPASVISAAQQANKRRREARHNLASWEAEGTHDAAPLEGPGGEIKRGPAPGWRTCKRSAVGPPARKQSRSRHGHGNAWTVALRPWDAGGSVDRQGDKPDR